MREEIEVRIAGAHAGLIESGLVRPVESDDAEERLWLDCDLASLAENRLGDRQDPRTIDGARRADWRARATTERPMSLRGRSEFERCYWLLEGDERAGTISVATGTLGSGTLRVSSFYLFPTHRSRGLGRRALAGVTDVLARQDLGVKLDTCWSWQRTVRFYLRAGMWIYMWKRDLTFCAHPETPPPRLDIGPEEARISVAHGDEIIALAHARRRGDALEFHGPPEALHKDRRLGSAPWQATSTLSLALALAGWPLVRGAQEWEENHYADGGPPEALASRIRIWEALDRHHGFRVETPRIPGLTYPTWEELQAQWAREEEELDLEGDPAG